MEQQEKEALVALMAGLQLAIIHLANVLSEKTGISREDVAASFEATAAAVPEATVQRAAAQLVLRQVASGIRNSAAGQSPTLNVSALRH